MKILSKKKYDVRKSLSNFGISEFLTVECLEYEVKYNNKIFYVIYEYEDIIWYDSNKEYLDNDFIYLNQEKFDMILDDYEKQLERLKKLNRIIE